MQLPEKIVACRKALGMTQDNLSEALDVSRQSISKWESGQAVPDLSKVVAMAKLFGVSMDYLAADQDLPPIKPEAEAAKPLPEAASAGKGGAGDRRRLPWLLAAVEAAIIIALAALLLTGWPGGRGAAVDEEIIAAIELGIVPEELQSSFDQPATEREIYQVLVNTVEKYFGTVTAPTLERRAAATNRTLSRENFAMVVFRTELWEHCGLTDLPLVLEVEMDWSQDDAGDVWMDSDRRGWATLAPVEEYFNQQTLDYLYSEVGGDAPWRQACQEMKQFYPLHDAAYDGRLPTPQEREAFEAIMHGNCLFGVEFCANQQSQLSGQPLLDVDQAQRLRPQEQLTRGELLKAAYRLYYSW